MINALVLRFMAPQATQEKALMQSITLMRAQKSGLVSENSAKLRFSYRFSSSIHLPAVSGIYEVISFLKILMSCRVT